ncbi:MAG TPA: CGNR zinc finger domain-containing protein [Trebonia sp.]|nr:CGNR zinc finger domain-containing protein [Trebonia sp.]
MNTTSTPAPDLVGGHVALDLVNTVSWRLDSNRRRDNLNDYGALIGWCQHAGLLGPATARGLLAAAPGHPRLAQQALHDVRALREHSHTLLAALADDGGPPRVAVAPPGLRALLLDALAHSDLTGPPMRWQLTPGQLPDISRLLALHVLDLLQSPQLPLLRRCQGPGCGWLFLDRTRSHTRRWCSSSDCGNRARVRRHYARHRDQPTRKPGTPALPGAG